MESLIPYLRLVHILGGVFWAGATFALAWFVLPTAGRLGPEGGRFLQAFAAHSRYPLVMSIASWSSVIAGLALWDIVSGHFSRAWLASPGGLVLSLGAVFGLLAAGHGAGVQSRNAQKLARLGQEIAAGGAPPTPEQAARLGELRGKLARGTTLSAWLLLVAAAGMALHRYL